MSHLDPARIALVAAGADVDDVEAAHLFECPSCAAACEPSGVDTVLASLRELDAAPAPARLRAIEEAVIATTSARKRHRTIAMIAAPIAALALAAAWLLVPKPSVEAPVIPASHAAVTVQPGARLATTSAGADEVVELAGEARFSVQHLAPGHRYRVRAKGDELEVRGTTFTIDADGDGFRAVVVTEGVVDVRPACCAEARLAAGEQWSRPAPPDSPSSAAMPATPPGAPSAPPAATSGATSSEPAAELLARGTAAYDAGNYASAGDLLRRAVRAEPAAAWARDATVLAGASSVLLASPDQIPSMASSVASLDAAAKRAARAGDSKRALMAQVAAARRSAGTARRTRYCSLRDAAGLSAALREEAAKGCSAPN